MEEKGNLQVNYQRGTMMEVLRHGSELTKQLQNQLRHSPKRSQVTKAYLIDKILACYEKAISMALSSSSSNIHGSFSQTTATPASGFSSWSEISDQDRNHHQNHTTHHVSTKRKALPRWSKRVKVACGSVSRPEGPLDDGHCWRKYGQKDIHGANFSRGYYRCTYSNSQGCLATRQVQKSDEDPTIFHVVYRGHNTCSSIKQHPILTSPPPNPVLLPPAVTEEHCPADQQNLVPDDQFHEIKTENLTDHHHQATVADDHYQQIFRNFSFPTTSYTALLDNETMENYIFPDALPYGFGESNHYGAGFNGHISESSVTDSPAPHAACGSYFGIELDPDFTLFP